MIGQYLSNKTKMVLLIGLKFLQHLNEAIIKIQKKARSKHKGWSDSGDLTAVPITSHSSPDDLTAASSVPWCDDLVM
jgi:hypothetical protein